MHWENILTRCLSQWLASDRCDSSVCQNREGYDIHLFSDTSGLDTGDDFDINYLVGSASGPIIISNVSFANTIVEDQAFASCNQVTDQQFGEMNTSGVIGLALPANSIIQATLNSDTVNPNNTETNTTQTGSILPGLWHGLSAASQFFGLGLQRLPSDGGNGNSTLTFGGYDTNYLPAARDGKLKFASVVPDSDNIIRKWKLILNDFRVTLNGSTFQIPLSTTGVTIPTAILDTGSPLNLANVNFLNALYGAVNVGPAADGSGGYYLDCTLPLEISINFGNGLIPIHPLDSNLKQDSAGTGSGGNSGCIGSFQALSGDSSGDSFGGAQIILGAPFLRSVYSVYSCDGNAVNSTSGDCSAPQVGLYPLYGENSTLATALNDFNKVRVQGQQLGDNSIVSGSSGATKGSSFGTGAKVAVGVVGGLLGILLVMATLLFIFIKRRRNRMNADDSSDPQDTNRAGGLTTSTTFELSEKERQRNREVALLYGRFVEDNDEQSDRVTSGGLAHTIGSESHHSDWDTSSKGYWEARAIKAEYQRKQRSQKTNSISQTSGAEHEAQEQESHELVDLSHN